MRYGNDEYPNDDELRQPVRPRSSGLESGKRTDTTLTANVALGFDVTRWLSFELAYDGE